VRGEVNRYSNHRAAQCLWLGAICDGWLVEGAVTKNIHNKNSEASVTQVMLNVNERLAKDKNNVFAHEAFDRGRCGRHSRIEGSPSNETNMKPIFP